MLKRVVQLSFLLIGGTLGVLFLPYLFAMFAFTSRPMIENAYVEAILGAVILFLFSLFLTEPIVNFIKWIEERLLKAPIMDLLFGTVGLIVGLSVAFLVSFGLNAMEIPVFSAVLPILLSILLGYLGFQVGFKKWEEFINAFSNLRSTNTKKKEAADAADAPAPQKDVYKLLDTSVIIDGRIADIAATGFLQGILVVPQFVLTELQHIADSSDTLKRTKGRRGLDILKRLQNDDGPTVLITDEDFNDVAEVDLKLVKLAKKMEGLVVTNDFNLNKVSDLHGVAVLNINDLANAVKPVVIPGEEMHVVVIKDGKEHNQGVAYLDDGTMIVIEDGRSYIGQAIDVVVTSVLQTSAGRMIFAKPKGR
ncbi:MULTISPECIES: PIN/TRAM domain-containing protein [Sporosarcina]|uniref:PIN/TRAM domain-containing protein n=1 Tax=Sporosarcina TaxID=1569 RepID=UPI00129A6180|nr:MULTISPECIES: PIN/TRAM domain-containing protein [Sporosarcina]GKV66356.1 putative PIN and TRAM-domain containing protein YacL [Sporosarcina sp. NCCP-2331]GLB56473.1 putative PIN and TRAM-domain containing protein YacL [Sporosarcina sp. NCCP-2378]